MTASPSGTRTQHRQKAPRYSAEMPSLVTISRKEPRYVLYAAVFKRVCWRVLMTSSGCETMVQRNPAERLATSVRNSLDVSPKMPTDVSLSLTNPIRKNCPMQYLLSRCIHAAIPLFTSPETPISLTTYLEAATSSPFPRFCPWIRTSSKGASMILASTPTRAAISACDRIPFGAWSPITEPPSRCVFFRVRASRNLWLIAWKPNMAAM
mmetsp:Transcript_8194/g.10338  ORF Transcript_8194/g.10338 Transcript_8194/m.10338 type:complete len:209 (-) Transcript_8194:434-1060(-)